MSNEQHAICARPGCGNVVPPRKGKYGGRKKYCSAKCRTKEEKVRRCQRHRLEIPEGEKGRKCIICGNSFRPHYRQIICSRTCLLARNREYQRDYRFRHGQKPEFIAAQRERKRKRDQKPEVRAANRERALKYSRTPEGRARQRERQRKPEVKTASRERFLERQALHATLKLWFAQQSLQEAAK